MLADLAARQHGVVAVWQVLPPGFGDEQIQYWASVGRLHRVHRGVYAVGYSRLTANGRWMAAALAHGPTAVLSHRTAAVVWGILRSASATAHVTVAARGRTKRRGIVVHQVRRLAVQECDVVDALPVTTVARTLLDLAASGDRLLDSAIEESEHRGLFDLGAVDAVCATPRPGVRRLRQALAIYRPVPHWDRSHFERRVFKAIRAGGLPEPAVNLWIHGGERDLVWVDQKLIVELDGPWHAGAAARRRDARSDATLQLHGWSVVRVPQHWFDTDPAGVVRTIRDFLSRAARTPARPGR